MNRPDLTDELDQARHVLTMAYERARAAGYQPGSVQMQTLDTAEQDYEYAQSRRDIGAGQATGGGADAADGDSGGVSAVVGPVGRVIDLDQVSRVIDLREMMRGASRRGPGAPTR